MIKYFTNIFRLSVLLLTLCTNNASANPELLNRYKTELSQIENYLQNIQYLSADFVQESPEGSSARGKFYLSRPGKMRIEYQSPTPIRVIVNGSVLAYQDLELEETSYLKTNTTPASFLTRKIISFSASDVELTDFVKEDGLLKVSVMKKNKKEAGEFTLIFKAEPLQFIKMEVKNDLDQITSVALKNSDFSSVINDDLFITRDNKLPN